MARENFKELEKDIVEFFMKRLSNFNIAIDLKFQFQANNKQKQLIKLTKIPDQYAAILNKDILVQVNEEYFDAFNSKDEDINKILFDKSIDLIETNLDKGTFKIGKANISTTDSIIKKYSYDKVKRAIETERLFEEQRKNQN